MLVLVFVLKVNREGHRVVCVCGNYFPSGIPPKVLVTHVHLRGHILAHVKLRLFDLTEGFASVTECVDDGLRGRLAGASSKAEGFDGRLSDNVDTNFDFLV